MKLLPIFFALLLLVSATEVGYRNPEKVDRLSVLLQRQQTIGDQDLMIVNYKSGSENTRSAKSTTLRQFFETLNGVKYARINNTLGSELFALRVGNDTGNYTLLYGGNEYITFRTKYAIQGGYDGPAIPSQWITKPTFINSSTANIMSTIFWSFNTSDGIVIQHFLSMFSNRPEVFVNVRAIPFVDQPEIDVSLDEVVFKTTTPDDFIYVKNGKEFVQDLSDPVVGSEPWFVVNTTLGASRSLNLYHSPVSSDDAITFETSTSVQPTVKIADVAGVLNNIISRDIWFKFTPTHDAKRLYQQAGPIVFDYSPANWWFGGTIGSTFSSASLPLHFIDQPHLASLTLSITQGNSNNVLCKLNDYQLFNRVLVTGNLTVEFPASILRSGDNFLTCRTTTGTAAINHATLRIAEAFDSEFWGGSWKFVPVVVDNLQSTESNITVRLNFTELFGVPFSQTQQLLSNSTFELSGPAAPWSTTTGTLSTLSHSGTYSMNLSVYSSGTVYANSSAVTGNRGRVAFWSNIQRWPGNGQAYVDVLPLDAAGQQIPGRLARYSLPFVFNQWSYATMFFDFSETDAVSFKVVPSVSFLTTQGSVMFDDFEVSGGAAFRLIDSSGFGHRLTTGGNNLTFSFAAPRCCGTSNRFYVLFTNDFFSNGTIFSDLAITGGVIRDGLGENSQTRATMELPGLLNPDVLVSPPAASAKYIPKTVSPTVVTATAQKLVYDESTGRGAIIKLLLWRKA